MIELLYLVPLFVLLALLGFAAVRGATLEHRIEILKVDLDTARLEVDLLREDLRDIHVRRRDLADDLTRERSRSEADRKLIAALANGQQAEVRAHRETEARLLAEVAELRSSREAERAEALRLSAQNEEYLAIIYSDTYRDVVLDEVRKRFGLLDKEDLHDLLERVAALEFGMSAEVAELRADNAALLSDLAFETRRDSAARAGSDPDARGLPPELGAEELSADEPAEPSEDPAPLCYCGRCRIERREVVTTGGGWSTVPTLPDAWAYPVCVTCSEWDTERVKGHVFRACLVCGTMTQSRDTCLRSRPLEGLEDLAGEQDVTP